MKRRTISFRVLLWALIMGVVVFGALSNVSGGEMAEALTFQSEAEMEFTFNPTISVEVSGGLTIEELTPGSAMNSNEITVTVGTNNAYGYILGAAVGSSASDTALVHTSGAATGSFESIAVGSNLTSLETENTWGYSVDSGAHYSGLPGDVNSGSNVATLAYTTSMPSGGFGTTNFLIGAYAGDAQPAGDYTNTIHFYAVTNTITDYIQDYDLTSCSTGASGADVTVYDIRDGSDYTVRYINGACWMTQNLRISGTVGALNSNFSNGSVNLLAGGDLRGSAGVYNMAMMHLADSTDVSTAATNSYETTIEDLGAWYNYCAASAGEVCGQLTADATQDICPAGWHLPSRSTNGATIGDIAGLLSSYNSGANATAFAPVMGGFYTNAANTGSGTNGYWWTSTSYSSNMQFALDNTSGTLTNDGLYKYNGYYIRCVRTE